MSKKYLSLMAGLGVFIAAEAHTVLLNENFNEDYTVNFPVMIDAAHLQPAAKLQSLFMDAQGIMRPWRKLKDVATSPDGYIATHSYYNPAGKANAWLCSRALNVAGKGFDLTFDAKSVGFRSPGRQSSLWIYVTEYPVTDENELPNEPTWVINDLPLGDDPYNAIGYFTPYKYSLDQFAGKTVYINFANFNEDRDLLALDNILVQRLDPAEMTVAETQVLVKGSYDLEARIKGTMEEGLVNWKLTAEFSNGTEYTESGARLSLDETKDFKIPFSINGDEHLIYTLTLSSDNAEPIVIEGEIAGLTFMPNHKVLMEEATGLWCGNCPMGQFTIESMMLDPEMNEKVIPVSVHVPSSAHANHLVVPEYATMLGMTIAPAFRLDREFVAMTFSQIHDTKYDPSNPESVAGLIRERAAQLTTMDIDLQASYVLNGKDTTAIRATAKVIPALTVNDKQYAIGFVLTENNVWLQNNPSWCQENYLSGWTEAEGNVGGWIELPKIVPNVRLQDVARGIYGYRGVDNSLPSELKADEEYSYTESLPIPNTLKKIEDSITGDVTINSPAIVAGNCGVVAYIIDQEAGTVINSAYVPLSELTEKRFTTKDLIESMSGVEEIIGSDENAPAEYYTIDGFKVNNPESGHLYIVRQGSRTKKVIM